MAFFYSFFLLSFVVYEPSTALNVYLVSRLVHLCKNKVVALSHLWEEKRWLHCARQSRLAASV